MVAHENDIKAERVGSGLDRKVMKFAKRKIRLEMRVICVCS